MNKITQILPNKEANVSIKSNVYYRLNKLMMFYMKLIGNEGMQVITKEITESNEMPDKLKEINEESPTFHYMTLYYLIQHIENAFKDAGLTQDEEITKEQLNEQLQKYDLELRDDINQ